MRVLLGWLVVVAPVLLVAGMWWVVRRDRRVRRRARGV